MPTPRRKFFRALSFLALSGVFLVVLSGADGSWNGLGGDSNWTNDGNWSGASHPTGNLESATLPNGAPNYPINSNTPTDLLNLTIQNGASLSLSGPLQVHGTLQIDAGGTLTLNGNNLVVNDLTVNGTLTVAAENITVTGDLTVGNGIVFNLTEITTLTSLTTLGTGQVNLSGFNLTVTGAVSNAGTIAVGANNLDASAAGIAGAGTVSTTTGTVDAIGTIATLNAGSGSTVDGNGGLTITNAIALNPNLTVNGAVTMSGAVGTLAVTGTLTQNGNLTATGAVTNTGTIAVITHTLDASAAGIAGAGTVSTTTGTVDTIGTITTLNTGSGSTVDGNGGLVISNAIAGNPDLTVNGTVDLQGNLGNLVLNATALNANGPLVLTGTLTRTAGNLVMGANALSVAGDIAYTAGNLTSTGTLTLNGGGAQAVNFTNATLANMTVNKGGGTATTSTAVTLSGTLSVTNGTYDAFNLAHTVADLSVIAPGIIANLSNLQAPAGQNISLGVTNNGGLWINNTDLAQLSGNAYVFTTTGGGDIYLDAAIFPVAVTGITTMNSIDQIIVTGDSLVPNGLTLNAGLAGISASGQIRTSGSSLTFQDALTLGSAFEADTSNNGASVNGAAINFQGDVLGTQDLTTVSRLGNVSFAGNVDVNNLALHDNAPESQGNISVAGTLTAASLATVARAYGVSLNGNSTVTNAVVFSNTGVVTLGDGAGDVLTFTNGVTATAPSSKNVAGTIQSTNSAINLGTTGVTLTATTILSSGSGAITLGAVGSAGFNLDLRGSGADVVASAALGAGTLILTGKTGGSVTLSGALTAQGLTTVGNNYAVSLNGGGTVTDAVVFSNTGVVTLGNDAGDSLTFTGGVTATAGGAVSLAGTFTLGANSSFGASTITANTTLGGALGTLTLSNATVNAGGTLVLGSGNATIINGANMTGPGNVVIDTTGAVHFTGAINLGVGSLTVTNTGGFDADGVVTAAGLTVTATTGTVNIDGAATLTSLTANAGAYNVALNGGGSVANAVTFNNTGTLVLSSGLSTGGFTASQPSSKTFGGTLSVTANNINLSGNQTLLNGAAILQTAGGSISFAALDGQNNNLTVGAGTGAGAVTVTGAVTNLGTGTGAALTVNSTGLVTFQGTVATNSGLAIAPNIRFNDNVTIAAGDTATTFNGTVQLDGLNFLAGRDVTFGDAAGDTVTLSSATVDIQTTANNGSIDFFGNITGAQNLSLITNGAGTIRFRSDVANNLTQLDADTASVTLDANVDLNTSASNGNITLVTDGLSMGGTNSINPGTGVFTLRPRAVGNSIEFASANDPGIGTIVFYDSDFTLSNGTFNLGGGGQTGDIHVGNTLGGLAAGFPLSVSTTGDVYLRNTYNPTNRNLTLQGGNIYFLAVPNISLGNGTLTVTGAAELQDTLTVTASGGINFSATVNPLVASTQGLTLVAGGGNISVTGPVGNLLRLGALTVTSGATVAFTGAVTATSFTQAAGSVSTSFSGAQDYTGNFDFTGAALNINEGLNAGGTIEITNAGLFTKNGTGVVTSTGTFTQNGVGSNSLGANITTTNNNLSFATAITLTQNVQLSTGAGVGNITLSSTVNPTVASTQGLTLVAGAGNIGVTGPVGNLLRLGALTVTSGATVAFTGAVTATSFTQAAGSVNTSFSGAQDYTGNFDFTGAILNVNNGLVTGGFIEITNAGLLTKNATGVVTSTGTFTQNGVGSNSIGANITTTNNNLSFATAITLTQNVQLSTGAGAGNITLSSTVNPTVATTQGLTLVGGGGNISVTGPVGNLLRLGALTVTSGATVAFTGAVTATSFTQTAGSVSTTFSGAQDYSGNFDFTGSILNLNEGLNAGGFIEITNAGLLTKNATGVVTSTGTFTQNGAGVNSVGANITTTNNNLSFATAITLTQNVQLSTGAGVGNITLSSTVNPTVASTQGLTLVAGAGNIGVTGPVGNLLRLGALTVTSGATVAFTGAVTATSFTQAAGSVNTSFSGAQDYTGNFDFTGTILNLNEGLNAGGFIEITNAGLLTKNATGVVTSTGTFTQNGAGANSLGANITTTNNNLSFATAITLTQNVQLSTGAGVGNITLSSTVNPTVASTQGLTLVAGGGNISVTGPVGNLLRLGALTVTSGATVAFTGAVAATSFTQAAGSVSTSFSGAQDYTGNFDFTGTILNLNEGLSAGGFIEITNAGLLTKNATGVVTSTGTFTQNGVGANSLGANITTTNNNLSFATAVTLTQNVQLSTGAGAGNIALSSTIDGTHNLTLTAGTGDVTVGGVIGGGTTIGDLTVTGNNISLGSIGDVGNTGASVVNVTAIALTGAITLTGNDYRTSGTQTWTATTEGVRFTGNGGPNGQWEASAAISLPGTDLYLDFNGLTLTLGSNLSVRDFVFFRGTLNAGGRTVTVNRNYSAYGAAYNPLDADRNVTNPGNALFASPEAASYRYYPGGGAYNAGTGVFATVPSAIFGNMDGSSWVITGNWYQHGVNLPATANWTLQIPDNSQADPLASPPFGAPYARMFRSGVAFGQITSPAGSAVAAPTAGNEGNANNGNNDVYNDTTGDAGWNFTRLEISSAQTLYDDLLEVTFNQKVANIGNALGNNTLALRVGNISHTGGTRAFEAVIVDFSDPAVPVYSHQGAQPDTNVLYLRVTTAVRRWNTDATGNTAVNASSTDRSGVARTSVPNLTLVKGTLFASGGKGLITNYGQNGTGVYTGATDATRPVLVSVTAGRAEHNAGGAYTPYDAHNYLYIRYSEPVTLTGGPGVGAANLASSATWGDANGSGTVTVSGFFTYPGTLERFARMGAPDIIHSIYRAGPTPSGTHSLLLFLAGRSNSVLWEGYLRDVTNPVGQTITVPANPNVVDAAANALEPTTDTYIGAKPAVSITNQDTLVGLTANDLASATAFLPIPGYPGWDIDAPQLAPYWPVAPQVNPLTGISNWELVVRDTDANNEVDRLDMHFMDNPSSYTDWHSINGGGYHTQTSTNALPRGVRTSSISNLDAFTLRRQGQTTWAPNGTIVSIDSSVNTPPFGAPNQADDPYFAFTLSAASRGWAPIDTLEMAYDETSGLVTDLAGNLLRNVSQASPWVSIEKTPPRIQHALAGVGMTRIYLRFSENVYEGAVLGNPLTAANFSLSGFTPGLAITSVTPLNGNWATGVQEMFLELNQPLVADDIVNGRIQAVALAIVDAPNNAMVATVQYLASNLGIGLATPLWASDGSEGDANTSGISRVARTFDGSENLTDRDMDIQVRVDPALTVVPPFRLLYDVDASDAILGNKWLPQLIPDLNASGNGAARTLLPYASVSPLFNFRIPSSDPEIQNGKDLTFIFTLGTLPVVRPTSANDPRHWDVFRLGIRDVTRQKGGITILNNVINPERGERTTVLYQMSDSGIATVQVFALDGSSVKVLQRGRQALGEYQAIWDGRNEAGNIVARGPYFIRVIAPGIDEMRSVLVVK